MDQTFGDGSIHIDRFRTGHSDAIVFAANVDILLWSFLVVHVDDIVNLGIAIGIKVIDDFVIFVIIKLIFVILVERGKEVVAWG